MAEKGKAPESAPQHSFDVELPKEEIYDQISDAIYAAAEDSGHKLDPLQLKWSDTAEIGVAVTPVLQALHKELIGTLTAYAKKVAEAIEGVKVESKNMPGSEGVAFNVLCNYLSFMSMDDDEDSRTAVTQDEDFDDDDDLD